MPFYVMAKDESKGNGRGKKEKKRRKTTWYAGSEDYTPHQSRRESYFNIGYLIPPLRIRKTMDVMKQHI
jgi:hypothetical protein